MGEHTEYQYQSLKMDLRQQARIVDDQQTEIERLEAKVERLRTDRDYWRKSWKDENVSKRKLKAELDVAESIGSENATKLARNIKDNERLRGALQEIAESNYAATCKAIAKQALEGDG